MIAIELGVGMGGGVGMVRSPVQGSVRSAKGWLRVGVRMRRVKALCTYAAVQIV